MLPFFIARSFIILVLHVSFYLSYLSFYYSWRGSNEPIVQVGKKMTLKGKGGRSIFRTNEPIKKRWCIGVFFSFFQV